MLCCITLPPPVLEESVSISKSQEIILNGISDNIDNVMREIEERISDERSLFQMIHTIIEIANIRSIEYEYFSCLLIRIYKKYTSDSKNREEIEESKRKTMLISESILNAFFGTVKPRAPFHFLRNILDMCYKENIQMITGEMVTKAIKESISQEYKVSSNLEKIVLFSLFCPEIEANDIETYNKLKDKYEMEAQQKKFANEYVDLFESVDSSLKENSWSLQKKLVRNRGRFKSLMWYIRNDEWQQVKRIITKPGFSKIEPLKLSIFDPTLLMNSSLNETDTLILPTLIEYAAYYGAEKSFEYLLISNSTTHPSYKAKNNRIWEFFSSCCSNKNCTKILELLKQKKLHKRGAMQASIYSHRRDIYDYLATTESISVLDIDPFFGSVLHSASSTSNINTLVYCIENGFDINTQDNDGNTSLHIASEFCNHVVCKILLSCKGINVNACNKAGQTCLHIAAINGDIELIKLLAEAGCNVDIQDKNRRTALHEAAERNKIDIVDYLIKKGANINLKCNFGWTPLHLAVKSSNAIIISKLLVLPNIDTSIIDQYGETAFSLATPQLRDCEILEPFRSYFVRENTKKK